MVPLAHKLMGIWYHARADHGNDRQLYRQAVKHFRALIDAIGPDPDSSLRLGRVLRQLDRPDEARAAWQQWIDVSPFVTACHLEAVIHDADHGRVQSGCELIGQMLDEQAFPGRVAGLLSLLARNADATEHDHLMAFLRDRADDLPASSRAVPARVLAASGRTDEAIAAYREVVHTSTDDADREACLQGLLDIGTDGAVALLDLLATSDQAAATPAVWRYRAQALQTTGDADGACQALVDGILRGRDGDQLRGSELADALEMLHDAGGAEGMITVLDQLERHPSSAWRHRVWAMEQLGRSADLVSVCRDAATNPRLDAGTREEALDRLLDLPGGPAAALQVLDRAERDSRLEVYGAWDYRGTVLERLGRVDEAVDHYRATALDRTASERTRRSALERIRRAGDPELALSLLERLQRRRNGLRDDYLKATCLVATGETGTAVNLFARVARDAGEPDATRTDALQQMIRLGSAEDVLAVLDGLAANQGLRDEQLVRARALAELGRTEEARDHYARALDDEGTRKPALFGLLALDGGPQQVLEFVASLHDDEQRLDCWQAHGRALELAGRTADALDLYTGIAQDADQPDWRVQMVRQQLARTCLRSGDADGALAMADRWIAAAADADARAGYLVLRASLLQATGRPADAQAVLAQVRADDATAIDDLAWGLTDPTRAHLLALWRDATLGPWLQEWHTARHGLPCDVPGN